MTTIEPVTVITDYVLGGAGLLFGASLLRPRGLRSARLLWTLGFFAASAAAFVGGAFHQFAASASARLHAALWDATLALIGATAGFLVSAALSGDLGRGAASTRWMKAGLLLTVAALAIQRSGLALSPNFNQNDLYHCLQTAALYFLYRGARLAE